MQDSARTDIFCPLPWKAITAQPFGMTLCCASNEVLNEDGKSPVEIFRGERYAKIRSDFLSGRWPKECSLCRSAEEAGLKSQRHQALSELGPSWWGNSAARGEAPDEISILELSFDNLCNLKCRMCSPAFSSRWAEDLPGLKEIGGVVPDTYFQESVRPPLFDVDSLLPYLDALQLLIIKGGEPLLNIRLTRFLKKLVETGVASRVTLRIVSNGTVLSDEYIKLIKSFKECFLTLSVDGVDPWFAYIRAGRFTAVDVARNAARATAAGIPLAITTAYQVYNMLSYPRLIEMFGPWSRVFLITLVTSHGLSPLVAPDPLRHEAKRRLQNILPGSEWPTATRDSIHFLDSALSNGSFDLNRWQAFQRMTRGLDTVRGQLLADVDPEIAAYLDYPQKLEA